MPGLKPSQSSSEQVLGKSLTSFFLRVRVDILSSVLAVTLQTSNSYLQVCSKFHVEGWCRIGALWPGYLWSRIVG